MYTGIVMNLPHRPGRLERFIVNNAPLKNTIEFKVHSAVVGTELNIDATLRSRVNPWNFEHLDHRMLVGYLGNMLSHLEVWKDISKLNEKFVFVFEDDATLISSSHAALVCKTCELFPETADLIWLNDWNREASKPERVRLKLYRYLARFVYSPSFVKWSAATEKTTEAYLITPRFAKLLHDALENNLGAVDEHIRGYVSTHPEHICFCVSPPLFTQVDRLDSDIR